MSIQVELVGGPNDGAFIPYCGPTYREPVPRVVRYIPQSNSLPTNPTIDVLTYQLQYRWTDSGRIGSYVLVGNP